MTLPKVVVDRIRKIVEVKSRAGFKSSVSFEAGRLIKNSLLEVHSGLDMDRIAMKEFDNDT